MVAKDFPTASRKAGGGKAARKHFGRRKGAPTGVRGALDDRAAPRGAGQARRAIGEGRGRWCPDASIATVGCVFPEEQTKTDAWSTRPRVTAAAPNGEQGTRLSISNSVGLGTNRPMGATDIHCPQGLASQAGRQVPRAAWRLRGPLSAAVMCRNRRSPSTGARRLPRSAGVHTKLAPRPMESRSDPRHRSPQRAWHLRAQNNSDHRSPSLDQRAAQRGSDGSCVPALRRVLS